MFVGLTFDQQQVLAKHDGQMYDQLFDDGRLRGCEVTVRANELVIAPGLLVCGGRLISNEGSTSVEVLNPTTGFMRLVLQIDLTAAATLTEFEQVSTLLQYQQTTLFPPLQQEDINDGGMVYQMELGIFICSGGRITGTHSIVPFVGHNGLVWVEQNVDIPAEQRRKGSYYLQVTGEKGYPDEHDTTISPNFRAIITGVKERKDG